MFEHLISDACGATVLVSLVTGTFVAVSAGHKASYFRTITCDPSNDADRNVV
jgi:hypothetical protein